MKRWSTLFMGIRDNWEQIRTLGQGGQSQVFLVRTPQRRDARRSAIQGIVNFSRSGENMSVAANLAESVWQYSRPELPSELGALKAFKTRSWGASAERRLK